MFGVGDARKAGRKIVSSVATVRHEPYRMITLLSGASLVPSGLSDLGQTGRSSCGKVANV